MLNVQLLRRVQLSIADEKRPFCMNYWACCIAGHIRMVLEDQGHLVDDDKWVCIPWWMACEAIGIPYNTESSELFCSHGNEHRKDAINRIDTFIAAHGGSTEQVARQGSLSVAPRKTTAEHEPEAELVYG